MSDLGNESSQQGTIAPEGDNVNPGIFNEQLTEHPTEPTTETATMPELNEQEQSDMNAITHAFERARDSVLAASQLAKEVAALRETVEQIRQDSTIAIEGLRSEIGKLQQDLTASRERNAMLDEHLVHARRQRDEEREKNYTLTSDLATVKSERDTLKRELDLVQDRNRLLLDDKRQLQEMNGQQLATIDSQERELKALKEKLAVIEAVFKPIVAPSTLSEAEQSTVVSRDDTQY